MDVVATRLRHALVVALRRRGKLAFLRQLPAGARVLDVGCGNNSPRDAKILRPDIHYTGLDIGDYNQDVGAQDFADAYVLVAPEDFPAAILRHEGGMDAVISAHNLEHCDDPAAVLSAMIRALRPGGRLYLALPCEDSVNFPRRRGTLNFFDDATHRHLPSWSLLMDQVRAAGLNIEFASRRYRPAALFVLGLMLEPIAICMRRNAPGGSTWALYGFESVIWSRRSDVHEASADA